MAPVPAFAAGNGKRASAASKDAGPSCRTSLRSARAASSARFGADGTQVSHGACDAPFGALRPAILVAVGCVNGAVSAPIRGNWGESSRADARAFERAQSLTAFRAFSIVRSTRKSPPVHTLISAAGAFFRPVGGFGRR